MNEINAILEGLQHQVNELNAQLRHEWKVNREIRRELDDARGLLERCGIRNVEFDFDPGLDPWIQSDLVMPVEREVALSLKFRINEVLVGVPLNRTLAFMGDSFLKRVADEMIRGFRASSNLRLPVPYGGYRKEPKP